MPQSQDLVIFSMVALVMVLTPGANMIYLISQSISQGRLAGIISLLGIVSGFIFYMITAILGLTAIFFAVPHAFEIVKIFGAIYLVWLAWKSFSDKCGLFKTSKYTDTMKYSLSKLFSMGFLTNLLNPKVAIFYISILPQFVKPDNGSVIEQSLFLGLTQIAISFSINCIIVLTASIIFDFLNKNPRWAKVQKWIMGLTLTALAIKLVIP